MSKLILLTVATLAAALLGYFAWQAFRPWQPSQTIHFDPDAPAEEVVAGREPYVADPVVGFRGPRNLEVHISMAALDATVPESLVRRSNNHGFIRAEDLPEVLTGPRVVVLGDSHTMGVVSTEDNLASVLERTLRADPNTPEALVLNAGCGYYSLYQYVLRARALLPLYTPRVLLVVVFLGNDFLDLENLGFPHLTDDLREMPAAANPPAERTSARLRRLALPDDFRLRLAFYQGLNQATYLHDEVERVPVMQQKATRCIELMRDLAAAHDTRVVYALLPSIDLTFPDRIKTASEPLREVVDSGVQVEFYRWFKRELARLDATCVDLLPVFQADGNLDLYATDFHIWRRGHRVVAESTAAAVRDALD